MLIGVGSPFGADRIGWEVVEHLKVSESLPAGTGFTTLDRPGPRLLETLEGATAAFIVDAMRAGLAPGTVRRLLPAELETDSPLLSSHGLGVAETLALGRALGALPEKLAVVGVEIGEGGASFAPAEVVAIAEAVWAAAADG